MHAAQRFFVEVNAFLSSQASGLAEDAAMVPGRLAKHVALEEKLTPKCSVHLVTHGHLKTLEVAFSNGKNPQLQPPDKNLLKAIWNTLEPLASAGSTSANVSFWLISCAGCCLTARQETPKAEGSTHKVAQ